MMKDLWNDFVSTGSVDAYLRYKNSDYAQEDEVSVSSVVQGVENQSYRATDRKETMGHSY